MYDTVNMRLYSYEVPGVSFIRETPSHLDDITGVHDYKDRGRVITGDLGGLTIAIDEGAIRISKGSLCKWQLGDNISTMSRGDVKRAIERLSDTLGLPMDRAAVYRLDVGQCFVMQHPAAVYYSHLGGLRYAKRLDQTDGVYYTRGYGRLAFYDKAKEAKKSHTSTPVLYDGCNLLRYENRYQSRLPHYLQEPEIMAATLYNEAFYTKVIKAWLQAYRDIEKVNDIRLNTEAIMNKKQFDNAARLALVEKFGGEQAVLDMIKEMQQRGDITKKQAFDMRATIKAACNSGMSLTVEDEAIQELNKKVTEAAMYYR